MLESEGHIKALQSKFFPRYDMCVANFQAVSHMDCSLNSLTLLKYLSLCFLFDESCDAHPLFVHMVRPTRNIPSGYVRQWWCQFDDHFASWYIRTVGKGYEGIYLCHYV